MSVPDDSTDVVVIGSGMAGSAIAATLTAARVRVTLLEQGEDVRAVDMPLFTDEWEFALSRDWAFDPNVRRLPADYPVVTTGIRPYLYNAIGGSTNHYAGFWHRLKPVDFRKGSEHGTANSRDWPISYEELEPYYERNDLNCGIAGLAGDPSHPLREPRQFPPIPHGAYARLVARGLDRLGWHWWPADNAIITEDRGERLACNACGWCMAGCPRDSIATATNVYLRPALRRGLDLRPHSRVVRITTNAAGAADGVEYLDLRDGSAHRVKAPVVVLSCNGIGTPRLLLTSACPQHPHGLANSSDQVGRNFMVHGYVLADLWFEEETEQYKGAFGAGPFCQEFYDTDTGRGFVNGMTITFGGGYGPAISALGATTRRSPAPWGPDHHREFERRFNHNVFAAIQGEDLPQEENRVTLDADRRDSSGLPAARIDYQLHDNDRRLLAFGVQRLREIADAAGARQLDTEPLEEDYLPPGWHLMGSCRMGFSPNDSVVDRWHRSWDVPGLVVCDGSSMVTGGAGNPTSTIGALALRCAEGILRDRGRPVRAGEGY